MSASAGADGAQCGAARKTQALRLRCLTLRRRSRQRCLAPLLAPILAVSAFAAVLAMLSPQAALTRERSFSPDAVPGLRVALGATMKQVRAAYGVKGEATDGCLFPCLMLSAPADGLRFFFKNDDWLLYEIRADAPFAGNIVKVRLGDSLDDVVGKLGRPLGRPWEYDGHMAYLFDADPHRLRCDFDDDNKCVSIFYWAGPFTS